MKDKCDYFPYFCNSAANSWVFNNKSTKNKTFFRCAFLFLPDRSEQSYICAFFSNKQFCIKNTVWLQYCWECWRTTFRASKGDEACCRTAQPRMLQPPLYCPTGDPVACRPVPPAPAPQHSAALCEASSPPCLLSLRLAWMCPTSGAEDPISGQCLGFSISVVGNHMETHKAGTRVR